jgi:hypothetical protein
MKYEKIQLFGKQQSRGTFDDFFNTKKYDRLKEAYDAEEYVQCEFVKDEDGALYIEARNVSNPDVRKYHKLNYQKPVAGLDISDDEAGCRLAASLY